MAESRPPVPTTRGRSVRRLAVARERFLARQPVEAGAVREPILASWQRSRDWNVAADPFELPFRDEPDRAAVLTSGAAPVIVESADELSGEPVSLILTDADGVVLQRRTFDGRLERRLDRASLCPGFSYAERYAGTNGIGTALQAGRPARVFGHEHYVEHLEDLACAAAPITHPTSGKVLGVVNLTGWRPDANAMMLTMVTAIARRVSEALLEIGGRRELALLHDYLAACARDRGPVLAVSSDLVMLNDRARASIDASDQDRLIALAVEALSGGRARSLTAELPSGTRARLQCTPSWSGGPSSGGVVRVRLLAPSIPAPRTVAAPPVRGMVGDGALWRACRQRVEAQFRAREWLLLEGEPGTGKLTLARAVHLAHTPGEHLRVLDASGLTTTAASAFAGPGAAERWLAEVREELAGSGTVILRHVDRLPEPALRQLATLLADAAPGRWVVATRTGTGPATGALAAVIEHFPQSVEVPPLRHHVEDVRQLVPFLIARLTHGGPHCSPDAMRMLLRHRWPGNVSQLAAVLRRVVAHRRTGTITLADLPAEVQTAGRRTLTPLESIECDAIVAGLHASRGNRTEAARELGMSRATIYRKIRDYGIVAPPSPG